MTRQDAITELRKCAGRHFDAELRERFVALLERNGPVTNADGATLTLTSSSHSSGARAQLRRRPLRRRTPARAGSGPDPSTDQTISIRERRVTAKTGAVRPRLNP